MYQDNVAMMQSKHEKEIIKSKIYPVMMPQGKIREHIALLMGGMSSEREVSLSSAEGIMQYLTKLNYKVTPIDPGQDIAEVLLRVNPDIVFNALHGTYGEDGCIPGMLEILNIPYTHSGVLASSIGFDKLKSKLIFIANKLKCPEYKLVKKTDDLTKEPFPKPYVIKPLNQGSSIGVTIVLANDDFTLKDYEFNYGDSVLVEKYIKGREISVAVIANKSIGIVEIVPETKFYDYNTKYTAGKATHIVPAPLPEDIYNKAMDMALKAHNLLSCKGTTRSDMLYNEEENELYLLEINTHPGMTPLSLVPEIAAYHGITFSDLLEILIDEARRK